MTTLSLPRWRVWVRRVLKTLAALFLFWLIVQIGLMLTIHFVGLQQAANAPADAIVVLGAGVNRDGRAGFALTRRSELGASLYKQGYATKIVCTGGIPYNRPRAEAEACRDVLMANGVPSDAILLEASSHSTEENALNTAPLLLENNLTRVIVVSDSYHLLRTGYLFGSRGLEVQLAGVAPEKSRTQLDYFLSLFREGMAFQWQLVKDALGLPFTRVPLL